MSKNTVNQRLVQFFARFRAAMIFTDFVSWKWLAVTTGVMVYSSFQNSVSLYFNEWQAMLVLIGICMAFYGIVDHGLADTYSTWIKGRELRKEEQAIQQHSRILNYIFLFLFLRIFATTLSSVWSGGEIGDMTTKDFDPTVYTSAQAKRDSTENSKLNAASLERDKMRNSEEERLAIAESECNKRLRNALRTGNQSQRDMWKSNAGFFDNIPRNKWYRGNKAFADRMHAAQAACGSLKQAEVDKTANAEQLYYAVSQDTSAGAYLSALGVAASQEQVKLKQQEAKRTNMVIIVDLIAVIVGLFARYILIKIEMVTGNTENPKTFAYFLSTFMEQCRVSILEFLEEITGLDLDKNGQVGQVTNRMRGGGSKSSNGNYFSRPSNAYTDDRTPTLSTNHSEGSLLARLSTGATTIKSLATPSYAPGSNNELNEYKNRWLSHWKQYNSLIHAVNAPSSGYKDPTSKANKLQEYQTERTLAAEQLREAGFIVDKKGNRYVLVPVA